MTDRTAALEAAMSEIIAKTFAPAIDFKAPYAKVMLAYTVRDLLALSTAKEADRMREALEKIKARIPGYRFHSDCSEYWDEVDTTCRAALLPSEGTKT